MSSRTPHHRFDERRTLYVDTSFVQAAVTKYAGVHVGFGSFAITIETLRGRRQVTFVRMLDLRFPDFDGRTHRVETFGGSEIKRAMEALLAGIDSTETGPGSGTTTRSEVE